MKKNFILLFGIIMVLPSKAQQIALNTDLILDAFQTPNIGAEFTVGERSTIAISVFGNYKPWGKDIKMLGGQPEYRYWFSGRPMHKHFVGISALLVKYDINWKKHIYDGDAIGLGPSFGYVFKLSSHLSLDAHASLGFLYYYQIEYWENDNFNDYTPNGTSIESNSKGFIIFPIKIGVTLSYMFK